MDQTCSKLGEVLAIRLKKHTEMRDVLKRWHALFRQSAIYNENQYLGKIFF